MPKNVTEATASEMVDAAYNARRGIGDAPADNRPPEQVAEDNRAAAEARLTNAESARERKAEGKRYASVRRALLDQVDGLRHGVALDAAERRAIVDGIVKRLGSVSDESRRTIAKLVDDAADLTGSGLKGEALKLVDDAAGKLANAGTAVADTTTPDATDDMSPAELAALISRG